MRPHILNVKYEEKSKNNFSFSLHGISISLSCLCCIRLSRWLWYDPSYGAISKTPYCYEVGRMNKCLTMSILILMTGCMQHVKQNNKMAMRSAEKPIDISKHPSCINSATLPIRIGWCGTNRRSLIDQREACSIINGIFKKHGFLLKNDYRFKSSNIECILSGYDPQKRVGYIFGGRDNLDEDAWILWCHPKPGDKIIPAEYLYDYLGEQHKDEVSTILQMHDKEKQQSVLQELVTKYRAMKSKKTLSLQEAHLLSELYIPERIFILFISQHDYGFLFDMKESMDTRSNLIRILQAQISTEKNDVMKKINMQRLRAIEKQMADMKRFSKSGAIERLRLNVQESIDWLRQNSKPAVQQ